MTASAPFILGKKPTNYTPTKPTLAGHLIGIDNALVDSGIVAPTDINGRTLADADHNKQFRCTGTGTVTIPSTLSNGFICLLINRAGGAVTIAGSGLTPDGDLSLGDDHFATISKDSATGALVRTTG